jgi:hypothetical protein
MNFQQDKKNEIPFMKTKTCTDTIKRSERPAKSPKATCVLGRMVLVLKALISDTVSYVLSKKYWFSPELERNM